MFFFLQKLGREDATVRLQSATVISGLQRIAPSLACEPPFAPGQRVARTDTLVIHYSDAEAVRFASEAKQATGCRIVCLGADIYDIGRYVALDPIVDHFVLPTRLHCDVVGSAVWRPCHVLPEGIDPIAMPGDAPPEPVTIETAPGWFGYPESFNKAFVHILPRALASAGIEPEQVTLITSEGKELLAGAVHRPFSIETFYGESGRISHALLSHFAYDGRLNSFIKSPNKLVTSLVRGITPIVSATPAYLELARNYGLEKLVFRNGADLTRILRRLPDLRLDETRLAQIATDLRDRLSCEQIARQFLELFG